MCSVSNFYLALVFRAQECSFTRFTTLRPSVCPSQCKALRTRQRANTETHPTSRSWPSLRETDIKITPSQLCCVPQEALRIPWEHFSEGPELVGEGSRSSGPADCTGIHRVWEELAQAGSRLAKLSAGRRQDGCVGLPECNESGGFVRGAPLMGAGRKPCAEATIRNSVCNLKKLRRSPEGC